MIEIDCEFPGGNILVERMDGNIFYLRPDLRDTEGDWFYWCFRVRGAGGQTLRFLFDGDVVGVRGPGVSLDNGRTWTWLGADRADSRSFAYAFPAEPAAPRFSFAMPYTQADLDTFLAAHAGNPHLRRDTLCRSRKGRPVECLSLRQLSRQADHRILLACRHHACEMMTSYALEGLMEAILSDDAAGRWLCDHVEFLIVPFVDKDGVEEGDQGKNRRPHDHGRDYAAACLYPEVQALRKRVLEWSGRRLRMAFDLHCPWIRGELSEKTYFVGMPDEATWGRVGQFSATLEEICTGPLPYRQGNDLPFGEPWNTEVEPRTFSRWMAGLAGVWFAVGLELPYANAQGAAVTAQSARAFGRDLAAAIERHLTTQPP